MPEHNKEGGNCSPTSPTEPLVNSSSEQKKQTNYIKLTEYLGRGPDRAIAYFLTFGLRKGGMGDIWINLEVVNEEQLLDTVYTSGGKLLRTKYHITGNFWAPATILASSARFERCVNAMPFH